MTRPHKVQGSFPAFDSMVTYLGPGSENSRISCSFFFLGEKEDGSHMDEFVAVSALPFLSWIALARHPVTD